MNRLDHRRLLALQLLLAENIGPAGAAKIMRSFAHAETVFEIDSRSPKIQRWRSAIQLLQEKPKEHTVLQELLFYWKKRGVQVLLPEEAPFPQRLLESPYAPALLFLSGELSAEDTRALSIVGTRQSTHYGERACRKLLRELAPYKPTVVSGLARGIDRCAHREALQLKLRTIAVLGHGHLIPLDLEGRKLARNICDQGAILSPFPPDWKPQEWTFPFRNRILSGLTQGVLVVESGIRGGALITAKLAMEEGKEVLAVPGQIDSVHSQGCNRLIADGAHPALDGAAIATLFRWRECSSPQVELPLLDLTPEESEIYRRCPVEPKSVDSILRSLSFESSHALAILTSLEMKGLIRMLPGNQLERER